MVRIVVIGGGIAGVEMALTASRTISEAQVVLVSKRPVLRVSPNLVYAPFGEELVETEVSIESLLDGSGVELVVDEAGMVSTDASTVELASGRTIEFDSLVYAAGARSEETSGHRLRTIDDVESLRRALDQLASSEERDLSIGIRVPSDSGWPPPAFEFALLCASWRSARGLDDVRVTLEIEESEPLELFGSSEVSHVVDERLERLGVEVLTNVPSHRLDHVDHAVSVDFAVFGAARLPGLPAAGGDGYYDVCPDGSIGDSIYAVGDAARTHFKAAFASGWQSRRVCSALGGDLAALGEAVGGMPLDQCEYQMDLGQDQTLCVRLAAPYVGGLEHDLRVVDVQVRAGRPDKLAGLLIHEALVAAEPHG